MENARKQRNRRHPTSERSPDMSSKRRRKKKARRKHAANHGKRPQS
ncbi:50S ribosomal protein bL37 [Streptomyces sp. RK9]